MSAKKGRSPKITLGMLKDQPKHLQAGKTITTSVPTFSIRFHADDEELEAIYPSEDEADDEAEKPDEELETSSQGVDYAPTPPNTSASSTSHSRDPSPMKEYLRVLGKRSTSMDAGVVVDNSAASGSDTWRLFHEIKGKITKTVEEKFSEMKSDRRKRTGRFTTGGSGSKDDSSISDSESVSESSGKGQEADTDSSPKKIASNKEVKIDEEEEVDEENDVKGGMDATGSANSLIDMLEVSDTPTVTSPSKCKTPPPHRRKYLPHLRRRRAGKSSGKSLASTSYSMSSLVRADDSSNEFEDVDVEPGVEACEENGFASSSVGDLTAGIPTTDYRCNPPSSTPRHSHGALRTPHSRLLRSQVRRFRKWLLSAACVISCLILPTYMSGFLCGIIVTVVVYSFIYKITAVGDTTCQREFGIPDYSVMPILEVPAVKEHRAINKHAGWMNEYPFHYEPQAYSVQETRPVYVRLESTMLRISETRAKIPKRAMWNERDHSHVKFDHQRIYDISQSQVLLLPEGLVSKRRWSKKYPICIMFHKNSLCKVDTVKDEEPEDKLCQDTQITAIQRINSESDLTSFSDPLENKDLVIKSGNDIADKMEEDKASGSEEFHDLTDTDEIDEDTFCHIDKNALEETCVYLFARTDYQKEEWYRKLVMAARGHTPTPSPSLLDDSPPDSPTSPPEPQHKAGGPVEDYIAPSARRGELDYLWFMSRFHMQVQRYTARRVQTLLHLAAGCRTVAPSSSGHVNSKLEARRQKMDAELLKEADLQVDCDVMWINALVGRVLFDVMGSPVWVDKVRDRIQTKLSTIKLPYFMEELTVTELEVGNSVPMIHRASCPMLDERGLWIDLDVTYNGSFCLTLETKLNLIKLKERAGKVKSEEEGHTDENTRSSADKNKSAMFDSDLEDTAESSTDTDSEHGSSSADEEEDSPKRRQPGTGSKILHVVNTIAASKYFQSVAENKYVKKAMREVSNTKIMLTVELKGIVGTMVVNIPPPPSDRLWYGFRTNPRIWLSARPKFGERQVNITHLVSYIEKKLLLEFQKKFVYPNLDDLIIPVMTSELPK